MYSKSEKSFRKKSFLTKSMTATWFETKRPTESFFNENYHMTFQHPFLPIRNLLPCIITLYFVLISFKLKSFHIVFHVNRRIWLRSQEHRINAFSDVKYLPAFGYISSNQFWLDGNAMLKLIEHKESDDRTFSEYLCEEFCDNVDFELDGRLAVRFVCTLHTVYCTHITHNTLHCSFYFDLCTHIILYSNSNASNFISFTFNEHSKWFRLHLNICWKYNNSTQTRITN